MMHDPGRALVDAVAGGARVLVTGPVAPDGDSIGAAFALARILRERGVEVVVGGTAPRRYQYLAAVAEMVPDERIAGPFAAVVIVDGDRHRLEPNVGRCFADAPIRAIVDHHVSSTPDGYTHAWIDPRCESTCGMLLRAFREWGVVVDRTLAELLFTGIVFDTGAFRHPNTTPELLRLCADLLATGIDHAQISVKVLSERSTNGVHVMGQILAGASFLRIGPNQLSVGRADRATMATVADGDLEGVVEALINSDGTDLAALLVEREDGTVKYSLRSRGAVDVAQLARQLHPTGGGHPRAAGASFAGALAAAEQHLVETLSRVTQT